jgi:hypothetical protein
MAITDFSTMTYDQTTGQTKQKKQQQLPYYNTTNPVQDNYLPYTGNQQQNNTELQQGNVNVMKTAQGAATATPQSTPLQQQTTQMTQKLMTDPNMGRDWSGYNTGMMSKFDLDRASAMKAAEEANAGMGGSGNVQRGLIDMALGQNVDRSVLENELEQQAYQDQLTNYLNAIGQGREQGRYIDESQTNYLNNLLNTRSAFEGERSQESTQNLQRELTAANITSSENIAGMNIASNERIQANKDYLTQQGINLDSAALYGYDDPTTGEHIYGQAELAGMKFGLEEKDLQNQTNELFGGMVDTDGDGIPDKYIEGKYDLLSNEDKREADKLYGYDIKDADGNVIGHVNGALQLEQDRVQIEQQGLELNKAQVLGYEKDTDGDGMNDTYVPGELDLAFKKYGIDLESLGLDKDSAYGYVQTDENGNETRIKGSIENQMDEVAVRTMLAKLEERGIDITEQESIYNFINSEIEAGRADPNAALNYLNNVLEDNGVTLNEADRNAIYEEIANDFQIQKYQFALSNPDMAQYDENGNFIDLTEEGKRYFGNYVNSTLYGESTTPIVGGETGINDARIIDNNVYITTAEGEKIANGSDLSLILRNANDPNNQNYDLYQKLSTSSKTINPRIKSKGSNTLDLGGAEVGDVVNAGGRLMIITSKKRNGRVSNFKIMDVATGTEGYFDGMTNSNDTVNNFDDWVNNLG